MTEGIALGIDPSLTSTAVALAAGGELVDILNVKTRGKKGDTSLDHQRRIDHIDRTFVDWLYRIDELLDEDVDWTCIEVAVLEAPSYGSTFGSQHERAGLWWALHQRLYNLGIPIALAAPMTRAKYITGSGASKKAEVVAHAQHSLQRDSGVRIVNDDMADAAGLAAMGARRLGHPIELIELSEPNLKAMESVRWPS